MQKNKDPFLILIFKICFIFSITLILSALIVTAEKQRQNEELKFKRQFEKIKYQTDEFETEKEERVKLNF